MHFDLLQPWSTFIMKTKLSPPVLQKMIKITDEILENKESGKSVGDDVGIGQIKEEFLVDPKIIEREGILEFFLNICKNYVIQAFCQSDPTNKEQIENEKWITKITTMWMLSQKNYEYHPIHDHPGHLSAVMYLKIPEYLPIRKSYGNEFQNIKNNDGAIIFTNNSSRDTMWGNSILQISPQVGDFLIFPASQLHQVYPFRIADENGERRSVSFNAAFTSKAEQEFLKKQQTQYFDSFPKSHLPS